MKKGFIVLITIFWISIPLFSQENTELKTDDEKASYALGVILAKNFQSQAFDQDIDMDLVARGIKDKLQNKELLFPEDSIGSFLESYIPEHKEKVGKKNAEESKNFLKENKKRQGIKVTASGLQYKVEKEGTGAKPTNKDMVSVNYVLKTIKGNVIEDSKKELKNKPADIPLALVIPGWQEGLKLMNRGAKYTLYVPSDLAYGQEGPTGPNQALVFEVELLDFKPIPKQGQEGMQITPEQLQQMQEQAQQYSGSGYEEDEEPYFEEDETIDYEK